MDRDISRSSRDWEMTRPIVYIPDQNVMRMGGRPLAGKGRGRVEGGLQLNARAFLPCRQDISAGHGDQGSG